MIGGIAQPLIFSKQALVFIFFWDVTPNMVVSFHSGMMPSHFPFCNKFGDVIIVQVWMRNFFSKCWYLTENVSDQRSCCQSARGIDAASYMSETDLAAYLGSRPRLTKVVSVDLVEAVNGSEIRASSKTTTWLDGAKVYGKFMGISTTKLINW